MEHISDDEFFPAPSPGSTFMFMDTVRNQAASGKARITRQAKKIVSSQNYICVKLFVTILAALTLAASLIAVGILYLNLLLDVGHSESDTHPPWDENMTTISSSGYTTSTIAPTMLTSLPSDAIQRLYSRINCFPELQGTDSSPWNISPNDCEARGCTYDDSTNLGLPWIPPCYMDPNKIGYDVVPASWHSNGTTLMFHLKVLPGTKTLFGIATVPIQQLLFIASVLSKDHLSIQIKDVTSTRFEVPLSQFNPSWTPDSTVWWEAASYNVSVVKSPFSFKVSRRSSDVAIIDTSLGGLYFSDQFIQLSTRLASSNIYGIGEQAANQGHSSLRRNVFYQTLPIFSKPDQSIWPREGDFVPASGVHPFYICVESDGNAHGVSFINSNAMEFGLLPTPATVIRSIGGIIDLHVYMGPTPENVVQQHTEFVGKPYFPPRWSLGLQLSFESENFSTIQQAIEEIQGLGISISSVAIGRQIMEDFSDFTLDKVNFGSLSDYFATNSIQLVAPVDAQMPSSYKEQSFQFLKWDNGSVFLGKGYSPGSVAFPDFLDADTAENWAELIHNYSALVPFSGIQLNLNEPTNFNDPNSNSCPVSTYDDPPYRTRSASIFDKNFRNARLSDGTVCLALKHANYLHYDVHGLYGLASTWATSMGLTKSLTDKRNFLVSQSTFPGSGQFSGHILSPSTLPDLKGSLISMIQFNVFGINQISLSACNGLLNQDICSAWIQLGALSPLFRLDYKNVANNLDILRSSSRIRFKLEPYLYSLFYKASQDGGTIIRGMFHEFPDDPLALAIDTQFLIGTSLLIVPSLVPQQNDPSAVYLPTDLWVQLALDDSEIVSKQPKIFDHCQNESRTVKMGNRTTPKTQIIQRGGSVNVYAEAELQFNLVVVFDCSGKASGFLFWEVTGKSNDPKTEGLQIEYQSFYMVEQNEVFIGQVTSNIARRPVNVTPPLIGNVTIVGLPSGVPAQLSQIKCEPKDSCAQAGVTVASDRTLVVTNTQLPLLDSFSVNISG